MSDTTTNVFTQLTKEIGPIAKERQGYGYKFRGIDDLLNFLNPALIKTGITLNTQIEDFKVNLVETEPEAKEKKKYRIHTYLKMTVTFVAPDGTTRSAQAIGEGVDSNGDKSAYKAQSGAFKYACFMGLCIPIEGALDEVDTNEGDDSEPLIDKTQLAQIKGLIDELPEGSEERFCKAMKVDSLSELKDKDFNKAVKAVEKKLKEMKS